MATSDDEPMHLYEVFQNCFNKIANKQQVTEKAGYQSPYGGMDNGMEPNMGKPKRDCVWRRHYRVCEDKAVICGLCQKKYKTSNVNRMQKHLTACLKCPETMKESLKGAASTSNQGQNTQNDVMDITTNSISSNSTNNHTETTSGAFPLETTKHLHRSLSNAIFVSGAPLAMVEHPAWLQFFEELQPRYKLPTRKTVSTKYLDLIHSDMQKKFNNEFAAVNQLHLQCDGWSSGQTEGIINFLVAKPEPVLIKSLDTKDNRHTGEYISEEILKIMAEHGEHKFVVLVGDNAKNIQRAFQLVKNRHPHITYINCAAHTLNLLCQDILQINVLKAFIGLAVDCVKAIKRSQVLTALLSSITKEKAVGETLKLPCKTRWGSHLTCMKSLENTKLPLQTLAVHEKSTSLRPEIKMTLLDEDFWKMNKQCISILEPITDAIFKLEADEINMHKVFITLRDVRSRLQFVLPDIDIIEEADKNKILEFTEKRTTMCIKPIHLAANLLDPVSQGSELSEMQETDAVEYIFNMANGLNYDIMPQLAKFRAKEGIWGKNFVWSHVREMNPITWWKGVCGSTLLSKIALRILTAPCTSAAAERSFSAQSNIYSKKRNRLTLERAGKITFISYNWNLLHRKDGLDDNDDGEDWEETEEASNHSAQSTDIELTDRNSLSTYESE